MYAHIENESAYEAAIARNIRINARKGAFARWMKIEGAARANDFLNTMGEFDMVGERNDLHPVVKAVIGDFFHKMRDSLNEWGGLTAGQTKAVLDLIARGEARVAERAALNALSTSGWIGTVGERRMFSVSVKHVVTLEGIYGTSYLHIMEDADKNVVIYKGTKLLEGFVTVKATVKDHSIRDGVKQTVIARPV